MSYDDQSPHGDGLGPLHNADSCLACHDLGGVGGGGTSSVNVQLLTVLGSVDRMPEPAVKARLRAMHPAFLAGKSIQTTIVLHRQSTQPEYKLWRNAVLDRMETTPAQPSSTMAALLSFAGLASGDFGTSPSTPVRQAAAGGLRFELSERNTPALFGAGLINAVPEKLLDDVALQQARQYPGITGRVPRSTDGRAGRFGWRGQVATLEDFVQNACAIELGLQLRNRRQTASPIVDPPSASSRSRSQMPRPHIDLEREQVADLVTYVASLPKPNEIDPPEQDGDGLELSYGNGECVFISSGCAVCHLRRLGNIEGIFSDFLLHDMGDSLADSSPALPVETTRAVRSPARSYGGGGGISLTRTLSPSISERQREWRTPPLWGVRDSAPYLHDGRAETLEAAIRGHGGEASEAARQFGALPKRQREMLVAFLKTLAAP
jgi:CxxC motif-containing protein (DUF1111 family)